MGLARITCVANNNDGGLAGIIRTALGLSGSETWKAWGGKYIFDLGADHKALYNLEKNHGDITAEDIDVHVWIPTSASLKSQLDTMVAATVTGTLYAGSTTRLQYGGADGPYDAVTIENVVIDGRTHTYSSIIVERCASLTVRNVLIFSGNGGYSSGVETPQFVVVDTPIDADGVMMVGGKGNGGLNCIRSGGTVRNIRQAGDSRQHGEAVGSFPGNRQQFLDTINRSSADAASDIAAYYSNDSYRRWQPGTGLLAQKGDSTNIRMVKHPGGSAQVTVSWVGWEADQWSTLPLEDRTWYLKWDGMDDATTFHYISGSIAEEYAVIEARLAGVPVTVPEGPVNWFAWLEDYLVPGFTVDGGQFYSPTADRQHGSFVTSYGTRGFVVRNVSGQGANDRVIGGEFIKGGLYEFNNCIESNGNEMEPVTFFGQDIICRHNIAPGIWLVPNGCPIINCFIQNGSSSPAVLNSNTGSTWVNGWSSNSNHTIGLELNGTATTPATCTVPENSWPIGLIPGGPEGEG